MKLIARVFALSLVVTGAFASTHIASGTITGNLSAPPIPMCAPDNTTNCCGACLVNPVAKQ